MDKEPTIINLIHWSHLFVALFPASVGSDRGRKVCCEYTNAQIENVYESYKLKFFFTFCHLFGIYLMGRIQKLSRTLKKTSAYRCN